ncbi:C4b-binding protein alpha chain-like isoform X2 [Chaetodon auriga]|uniref:C4b-binding protein alpha chain-like isoform X2 n=1 Tax=Chaetodon auriga TaxID=39042 RepID=UPI00403292CF
MGIIYFLLLSCLGLAIAAPRRNCGSAGEVENGHIDYSEGTEFGDKIVITCNPGYQFIGKQGPRGMVCGDQGWMGKLPSCKAVTCDPPPMIVDGTFSPIKETYSYGDIVQYSCQSGLTLNGSKSVSCSDDGTFQPAPPTCIMVQCKDPDVKNGEWVQGSRPPFGYKATVTFKCRSGFIMNGESTQTCEINSEWSPGLPTCETVTCEPPPMIVDGTFSPIKDTYTYGDAVLYSCQNGLTLNGSKSVSCSDDGTFQPAPPTCIMVQCAHPGIENADWVQGSRPPFGHRATATFKCRSGFIMKGESTQICEMDSQWSPGLPICE